MAQENEWETTPSAFDKKDKKENEKLMRYSQQLAMLGRLCSLQLISEKEYSAIKIKLMSDYNIISDITA